MKRAHSDSLVAGFSMIEALATLALTATIILALSSVAGQWLPNWRRGFVDLQRVDLLGIGLEGWSMICQRRSTLRPRPTPQGHYSKATPRP